MLMALDISCFWIQYTVGYRSTEYSNRVTSQVQFTEFVCYLFWSLIVIVNEVVYNHLDRISPDEQAQGRTDFRTNKAGTKQTNMAASIGNFQTRIEILCSRLCGAIRISLSLSISLSSFDYFLSNFIKCVPNSRSSKVCVVYITNLPTLA